jgi:hypothetical protein
MAYQPMWQGLKADVERMFELVKREHPGAWSKAQGHDDGEFNKLLAAACKARLRAPTEFPAGSGQRVPVGDLIGLNWKRGNIGDHSRDILAFPNPTGCGDATGRFPGLELVDVIIGHEQPGAHFGWLDVTEATIDGGTRGGWAEPGPYPGGSVPDHNTSTEWTAPHTELLRTLKAAGISDTRRVAEQFAASFPNEGWGQKSAGPGRPLSHDVIAMRTAGRLIGFRITDDPVPTRFDLAGQIFHEVQAVRHVAAPVIDVRKPTFESIGGDRTFNVIGRLIAEDYRAAGRAIEPERFGQWVGRVVWDFLNGDASGRKFTMEESIRKHRNEWRSDLGLGAV